MEEECGKEIKLEWIMSGNICIQILQIILGIITGRMRKEDDEEERKVFMNGKDDLIL